VLVRALLGVFLATEEVRGSTPLAPTKASGPSTRSSRSMLVEMESLAIELDGGDHVFICNIFDEEENEDHYPEGMRTSFTVE
jgi:hypothetical protein